MVKRVSTTVQKIIPLVTLLFLFSLQFFFKNISIVFTYVSYQFILKIMSFLNKKVIKKNHFFKNKFLFFLNTVLMFFFKKPTFLLVFFKKVLWVKSPDNIKKIIYFIRSFFKRFSFFFIKFFHVHGFFFLIRGKIGVYGNSRKKIQRLKYGSVSSTNFTYN